jgi:hypothetical protein
MREILPAAENIKFCRIYQEFCMLKKFPNFSSLVDVGKFPGDLSEIPHGHREFFLNSLDLGEFPIQINFSNLNNI